MESIDWELKYTEIELELQDEKGAKEKLESENEELRDKVIDLKQQVSNLESDIEELEQTEEGDEVYKICGEDVTIITNDIAYKSYFEQFAEKSKHYSINELTDKLKHL